MEIPNNNEAFPSLKRIQTNNFGKIESHQCKMIQEVAKSQIESFNFLLREGLAKAVQDLLPDQFEQEGLHGTDRISISIQSATISPPTIHKDSVNVTSFKTYPAECRLRATTYKGKLQLTFSWSRNNVMQEAFEKIVGEVPIMIKSDACHLRGLTPKQLVQRGEEAEEFGGYFIVNGNEKILRLIILQRRNYPLALARNSWKNRGTFFSEFGVSVRCVKPDQTASNMVLHYLTNGTAQLMFSYQKEIFLVPIIMVLKCMTDMSDHQMFNEIIKGQENNNFFKGCITNMMRQVQNEGLHSHIQVKQYVGEIFRIKCNLPTWFTDDEVTMFFTKHCICTHLENSRDKFNFLVIMIRKLFAMAKNECAIESADNPMNQEVLLPGHLYLMLIKEKLQGWLTNVRLNIQNMARNKPGFRVNSAIISKCVSKATDVGHAINYLLSTGNLLSKSGLGLQQSSGLAIIADKLNFWRYMSHFRSIHRGSFFQEMRTTTVRKLLPEAWGFLCPVHTPDGAPCGLLNHLSALCEVANEQQPAQHLIRLLCELGMSPLDAPPSFSYKESYSVLLDGRSVGWLGEPIAQELVHRLRFLKTKRLQNVPYNMEIAFVPKTSTASQYPGLFLFTEPARMLRPVQNLTTGTVEYIGTFEQAYLDICIIPEEAHEGFTTHMEIQETAMLSILANQIPYSDFNQSPRNMYECQMGKQTMGLPCHAWRYRADHKMYRIQNPQSPLVRPAMHDKYHMDDYPMGTNAIVAVISYTGYDMEDAMVLNKSSLERGFKHASIYKSEFITLKQKMQTVVTCVFGRKETDKGLDGKLDMDGLPFIGTKLTFGSPLYSTIDLATGLTQVHRYKSSEEAYILEVKLLGNDTGTSILQDVCLSLWLPRNPIIGDKFASRHGQKGVCSQKWPMEDMPFTESGMTPDIIFNPHGFPSRMTIGMMIESMAGKSAACHGLVHDATPFKFSESEPAHDYFGKLLKAAGYNYFGTERMYSGIEGRELEADIFFGVVYYQRLRHMVADKFQVRTTGPIDPLTHQPVKGRMKGGGIRFGEMERDSLLAHGTSFLLHDRLFNCSDKSLAYICSNCGSILSPAFLKDDDFVKCEAWGITSDDRSWRCISCKTDEHIEIINIPFVFRYFCAELAAMNIKVKLKLNDPKDPKQRP